MKIEGASEIEGLGFPGVSLLKKAASGIKSGFSTAGKKTVGLGKKTGKLAYKGGKFAVKLHVKAFLKLNKFALKGMCALPGPLRAAAVGAAITAASGGAGGAAAPMVSQVAADAICRAMQSGKKADADKAEGLMQKDGIAFAKPTIWQEILGALGIE